MRTTTPSPRSRISGRAVVMFFALVALIAIPIMRGAGGPPTALQVVNDLTTFAVSDRFSVPVYLALLTDSHGVYFANAHYTGLFGWQSGAYTRLLQANDPHPGITGSVTGTTGLGLTANADGDLAMLNYWLGEDGADMRGIFVYHNDTSSFEEVVRRGDDAPVTPSAEFWHMYVRGLNNNHQVVFLGYCGPTGTEHRGIFVGSPSGPTVKIALEGDTVSGVGTIEGLHPIGIDSAGNVAFSARIGATGFGIFIGSGTGVTKIAANGDLAPGTGSGPGTEGTLDIWDARFFMNAGGQVAFGANVLGDPTTTSGIWIGSASGPPEKLVLSSESTPIGGTFGSSRILGLNDSGLALFLRDSSVSEALFVKSLSADAEVVAEQGDTVPGDSVHFDQIPLALLNNSGNVAFLAVLDDLRRGWFYDAGDTVDPVVIAIEGDTVPGDGTFGLASVSSDTVALNGAGQLLFNADILGPDAAGLFLWTPPNGGSSILQAVVTSNTTLPSGAKTLLRCFGGTYDGPRASDNEVLFWALKAGGQATIFTERTHPGKGGKVRRIIGEGDVLPGGGTALMLRFPTINDREEVAVWAYDVIDGSGEYPASAIVLSSPSGGLESLVRTGDPVPGPGGLTFEYVSGYPDLNNSGEVAFRARMSNIRDGIFVASTTGVVEVIRDGEPAPPTIGGDIRYLGNAPAINDDGEVAFYGQNDDGPRIGGLFVKGASGIRTIVADGVSWDSVEFSSVDPQFQFNNEGSVAFYSNLSGAPDAGIFIGDGFTDPSAVALLGDSIPGSGTISELRDPGFSLNNSNQVAFWARISGVPGVTSGFYLWSPPAGPPEPRLLQGQALPGGGTAGLVGWGGFGAYMVLADSGEMAMLLENVTGTPDLPRIVIADRKGKLRKFLTGGEPAPGVVGTLARFYPLLEVNRAGQFFTQTYLVGGTAKAAIYRNLPAKKP